MEENGPIQGLRKHAGVLIAGSDMASVDATCCRIMGIDPSRIGYLQIAAGTEALAEPDVRQLGVSIASVKQAFDLPPGMSHLRLA
jgi:uncharacterized protein (DUF362 family)